MNPVKQKRIKVLRLVTLWLVMITFPIMAQSNVTEKPKTNIADALKFPRTENSMPGKFPGKVVQVNHPNSVVDNKVVYEAAYDMVAKGMLSLTGAATLKDAWKMFVNENDRVGLKLNPIGGPTLSTSIELTQAVIKQLEESGIPRSNILIWDRRGKDLIEVGFTKENFPGIKIVGTESPDENGSYYDSDGKLYSEQMIDKDWYFWADVEGNYDAETMPYMVNDGKYSYFSKISTQMVDKIINMPILKWGGTSFITFCMKNLSYGAITNTGRLHKSVHFETIAGVCSFPPLRDKVVLNIGDAIKGSFSYGPGSNEQFYFNFHTILIGTDPVAIDRIAYDIILKKRIEEKIEREDIPNRRNFLNLAQEFKLGVADLDKIQLHKINLK